MTRKDGRGPPIELDTEALDRLASALDVEPVVSADLIGSHASGRPGPLSDVDVAVWLDPELDPAERFAARLRLMDFAAAALGTAVDLVVLNDAPPLLQHRARRGAIPLVDRDAHSRVRFEADALVRYLDTAPLREELARGLEHRLAEDALVDPERVRDRLARLDRMLSVLEGVRGAGKDAYLVDLDMRLKTERALQLAVQICIDIGAHLIAELGLEQPDDYRGVFRALERADLIEGDLADRLGEAAGQRNLLVHGYADIDDAQIWASLAQLDGLRAFAVAVNRALEP